MGAPYPAFLVTVLVETGLRFAQARLETYCLGEQGTQVESWVNKNRISAQTGSVVHRHFRVPSFLRSSYLSVTEQLDHATGPFAGILEEAFFVPRSREAILIP